MYALILVPVFPLLLLGAVLGLSWWEDRILPPPARPPRPVRPRAARAERTRGDRGAPHHASRPADPRNRPSTVGRPANFPTPKPC